jgi:hypothetical protein
MVGRAARQAQTAAALLGLEAGPAGWNRVLLTEIEADPKRLGPIAATVGCNDFRRSSPSTWCEHPVASRCVDMIETWGYQPSEIEHSERLKAS